jgi:hypothetical protein
VALVLEGVMPAELVFARAAGESPCECAPRAPSTIIADENTGWDGGWLGYPRARVVPRCGARRCLPKSWLAVRREAAALVGKRTRQRRSVEVSGVVANEGIWVAEGRWLRPTRTAVVAVRRTWRLPNKSLKLTRPSVAALLRGLAA